MRKLLDMLVAWAVLSAFGGMALYLAFSFINWDFNFTHDSFNGILFRLLFGIYSIGCGIVCFSYSEKDK